MRLLAPLLACALLSIPAASGSDSSPDYRWPLDTPRVLTSSFGEFRTGRLHAGVDLRSAVGTKVYAPADGYVSRVRSAATGYGKAVYVQFTDGRSVVFGHLDDYAPAVRAYVQREQHARESYTVDLYPEATLFPIKRGDLIGLSGQTGIGAPHLHYELRDNNGWPINPCLLGVTWPDTTPPAIRKILVMPKGPDCLLDGDCVPLIVEPRATQQRGRYVCDPVHVTGQVGFGVDVIDTGDNGGGKLGVRTTRVVQDDVEQFRLQIDQFSYDHIRGGAVAYHPYLMNEGRFLLQWRWPGNKAEIFPAPEQDGWLSVNSESSSVDLHVEDFLGNEAVVTIPLIQDTPAPIAAPGDAGAGKGQVSYQCMGDWLMTTVSFANPEQCAPVLNATYDAATQDVPLCRVGSKTFRCGVMPPKGTKQVSLTAMQDSMSYHIFEQGAPERSVSVGDIEITVNSDSPYGRLFMNAKLASDAKDSPFPVLSDILELAPAEAPINAPIDVSFPIPNGVADPNRLSVYRHTGRYWTPVETKRVGNRLVATTRNLGTMAVMEDTAPPAISDIVAKEMVPGASSRPRIRAAVSDIGTGINDVRVTLDGKWLLFAYDPERACIEWEQDEDLPLGAKTFTFTITDGAGNITSVERTLCRPGKSSSK